MIKNAIIAILTIFVVVASGSAFFLWQVGKMQAPLPSGEYRADLTQLESAAAWNALVETIRVAGDQVLREGENGAISPQDAIERFNGLLTILATTTRMPLNGDPARPLVVVSDLLPALSKIGGNSPDADYHTFPISPEYSYQLRGTRGNAPFFNIQVQSKGLDLETMRPSISLVSSLSDTDLVYDEHGWFEVLISRERPKDHKGLWMTMDDDSFVAVVREYHHDREVEGEPQLHVEIRGDVPAPAPLTDAEVASRIQQTAFMSKFWFDARTWMPDVLEPERVNSFPPPAESDDDLGLNRDVTYRVGAWALAPDEALIVEGRFPESTPYWIFQIGDRWHETADFRRRKVHLNNQTIRHEPDGSFRVAIASSNPGYENWLDTGERSEGFMSFRWVPVGRPIEISTRVQKVGDR